MSALMAEAGILAQLVCPRKLSVPVVDSAITAQALIAHGPPCTGRAVVFADRVAWRMAEPRLAAAFAGAYPEWHLVLLTGGEACKHWDCLHHVLEQMSALKILRRGDALYALGGGTVLDLVGFAASVYRRGTALTKLPTTLMGQVDAAIGLKNAINLDRCKNLVGSFAPPHSVLLDFSLLDTLPSRHWSNGMAEVIKLGLATDARLVHELAAAGTRPAAPEGSRLRQVFRRAISGMVAQLNANPYERSLQRAVDFGHWLSPQLEMADGDLLHGEAVAVDMALSLTVALRRGLLPAADWALALRLLASWQLPLDHPAVTQETIESSLESVVRHRGGSQQIPLCAGLGRHVFVNDLSSSELLQAQRQLHHHLAEQPVEAAA